jgi:nicotinamide-nucleotide amidase
MSSPRAETLAIGSELLGPWRVDTNGLFLSRRLGEKGIAVVFRTVVGDDIDDLQHAFRVALARADIVVATGGLGPTVDDVTREAVAGLLGLPLQEDAAVLRGIEERFRRYGYEMAPNNRRQAMVPRGAEVLPNRMGTAPGLLLAPAGRILALLPGVPAEMERMTEESLLPRLGVTGFAFAHRVIKITGPTESEVDRRLADTQRGAAPVEWTILASPGQIEIHLRERLAAGATAGIDRLDADIARTLGDDVFGRDSDTLEAVVERLLLARGQTVAIAESITGGAVARRITSIPGASNVLRGGAVCYTDDAKVRLAGVAPGTLTAHGAVSAEVALEMAVGIRRALGADWGVSTTGFAGPASGGTERPVGTLILGLSGPGGVTTREMRLPGNRAILQERAAQSALDLLRRALLAAGS